MKGSDGKTKIEEIRLGQIKNKKEGEVKKVFLLVIVLLGFLVSSAGALEIQVETNFPFVSGLDETVDETGVRSTEYFYPYYGEAEINKSRTATPIRLNPQPETAYGIELNQKFDKVRILLGGKWLKDRNSVSGKVPGRENKWWSNPEGYAWKTLEGFVNLWDSEFSSYWYNNGQYYPTATKYLVARDFVLNSYWLRAEIPTRKNFKIIGGLGYNYWKTSDNQSVDGIQHSESSGYIWTGEYYSSIYDREYEFHTNSTAKINTLGLELGLDGNYPVTEKLSFGGKILVGWHIGTVKEAGHFIGNEEIFESYNYWSDEGGYGWLREESIQNVISFSNEYNNNIKSIEAGLNLQYNLSANWSLQLGYFYNRLEGLPIPARFHYQIVSSEEPVYGAEGLYETEWQTGRTTDVSISGWKIAIEYSF